MARALFKGYSLMAKTLLNLTSQGLSSTRLFIVPVDCKSWGAFWVLAFEHLFNHFRHTFVFFGLIQRPKRVGTVWPGDLELSLALWATDNYFSHTHRLTIPNYYKLAFNFYSFTIYTRLAVEMSPTNNSFLGLFRQRVTKMRYLGSFCCQQ